MNALDLYSLNGQVAIVTAAGAGIGRATAELLASAGASVVVSDLKPESAEEVAEGIRQRGGETIGMACDVTDDAALEALVNAAVSKFGKLTLLVNNAGGGGPQPFDMPMANFEWAYRINVYAAFRLCQLCVPHMQAAGGGAIVNISSMAGENTNKRMASYASSKAAVNHLTRNMAYDLGPLGIRVNAVAPGAIKTQALASVLTPEIEAAMVRRTPLGRLGKPEDIAQGVHFLLSPAAAWISGQVLTVSGGGVQELD
jgi:7-alpha-hydroxysteroid dehydrogenase